MGLLTEFELEYTILTDNTPPVTAIVLAAGNATRMGGNKQLMALCGIPVLARSLLAFERCKEIRDIVVVAREEDQADVQALADTYAITKLTAVVPGGEERQDSVENGLNATAGDTAYVAIHDGARPLVTTDLIEAVLAEAKVSGGAAPGVKVKDTIKRVSVDRKVAETLRRSRLYAMQTPQIFDFVMYKKAFAAAKEGSLAVTDDCQIFEAAGFPVSVLEGAYDNIKITTPEDMAIARALLEWKEHE